jgi:MoxR-like ATPase
MADLTRLHLALEQAESVVFGHSKTIRLALACFIARGHLLLEDLPGTGKTTLAQAFSRLLGLSFARVQFTSDLLPADLTGLSIYDKDSGSFRFLPGPVFTQMLLADEINRATPKTQSALLEAMAEGQVSTDGTTRPLPQPFFVIATQNPVHQTGTFPLPESQLDRFLMRLSLGYPDAEAECALLAAGGQRANAEQLKPCLDPATLLAHQAAAGEVFASPALVAYVQALLAASRAGAFTHGLSPRAGLALLAAARALAYLDGRRAVLPDDVQAALPAVAAHRLSARGAGASQEDVEAFLRSVPIP